MTAPHAAPSSVFPAVRRARGRPRISHEPTIQVTTTLTITEYDRLSKIAAAQHTSVAHVLRDRLRRKPS